jgi:hypothetical protein
MAQLGPTVKRPLASQPLDTRPRKIDGGSLNNYDYADQDPTNIVDPSGTVACWVAHLFFKKCTPKVKKHHPTAQDWCNIGADLFYDFVGGRADADPDLPEIQSEWCEQPSGGSMTYA